MYNIADNLCKDIEELRTMINKMSMVLLTDESENNQEILEVSQKLDILIVKYSLLIKTTHTKD